MTSQMSTNQQYSFWVYERTSSSSKETTQPDNEAVMASPYDTAFATLALPCQRAVETILLAWSAKADMFQVVRNVEGETALGHTDFSSFLARFGNETIAGNTPEDSWFTACRAHKKRGREIPPTNLPVLLGRAKGLDDHAAAIADSSGGMLLADEAKKHLLKHANKSDVGTFDGYLRAAPLGKHDMVWATFHEANSNENPFNFLPNTHTGICTALGLGDFPEAMIVLIWNHAASGSPALHRPTIADAEAYRYYRPNPNAASLWGLTEPLPPNLDGLHPQPELVLSDPTSIGLQLPFLVFHA